MPALVQMGGDRIRPSQPATPRASYLSSLSHSIRCGKPVQVQELLSDAISEASNVESRCEVNASGSHNDTRRLLKRCRSWFLDLERYLRRPIRRGSLGKGRQSSQVNDQAWLFLSIPHLSRVDHRQSVQRSRNDRGVSDTTSNRLRLAYEPAHKHFPVCQPTLKDSVPWLEVSHVFHKATGWKPYHERVDPRVVAEYTWDSFELPLFWEIDKSPCHPARAVEKAATALLWSPCPSKQIFVPQSNGMSCQRVSQTCSDLGQSGVVQKQDSVQTIRDQAVELAEQDLRPKLGHSKSQETPETPTTGICLAGNSGGGGTTSHSQTRHGPSGQSTANATLSNKDVTQSPIGARSIGGGGGGGGSDGIPPNQPNRCKEDPQSELPERKWPCVCRDSPQHEQFSNCQTKKAHVSQLTKHHERHGVFYCSTCWRPFPRKQERDRHLRTGCLPVCIQGGLLFKSQEACHNYDRNPTDTSPCLHGADPAPIYKWARIYRIAFGLGPYDLVPNPALSDHNSQSRCLMTRLPSAPGRLPSHGDLPRRNRRRSAVRAMLGSQLVPDQGPGDYTTENLFQSAESEDVVTRDGFLRLAQTLQDFVLVLWQIASQPEPQLLLFHMEFYDAVMNFAPVALEPSFVAWRIRMLRALVRRTREIIDNPSERSQSNWTELKQMTASLVPAGGASNAPLQAPWNNFMDMPGNGRMASETPISNRESERVRASPTTDLFSRHSQSTSNIFSWDANLGSEAPNEPAARYQQGQSASIQPLTQRHDASQWIELTSTSHDTDSAHDIDPHFSLFDSGNWQQRQSQNQTMTQSTVHVGMTNQSRQDLTSSNPSAHDDTQADRNRYMPSNLTYPAMHAQHFQGMWQDRITQQQTRPSASTRQSSSTFDQAYYSGTGSGSC